MGSPPRPGQDVLQGRRPRPDVAGADARVDDEPEAVSEGGAGREDGVLPEPVRPGIEERTVELLEDAPADEEEARDPDVDLKGPLGALEPPWRRRLLDPEVADALRVERVRNEAAVDPCGEGLLRAAIRVHIDPQSEVGADANEGRGGPAT